MDIILFLDVLFDDVADVLVEVRQYFEDVLVFVFYLLRQLSNRVPLRIGSQSLQGFVYKLVNLDTIVVFVWAIDGQA